MFTFHTLLIAINLKILSWRVCIGFSYCLPWHHCVLCPPWHGTGTAVQMSHLSPPSPMAHLIPLSPMVHLTHGIVVSLPPWVLPIWHYSDNAMIQMCHGNMLDRCAIGTEDEWAMGDSSWSLLGVTLTMFLHILWKPIRKWANVETTPSCYKHHTTTTSYTYSLTPHRFRTLSKG